MKILFKLLSPQFILRIPILVKYRLNRFYHEKILFGRASKEVIFSSIWRHNYWGSGESLSGPGSTLYQTKEIRKKIPILFQELRISSIFDAPCGDFHWMSHVLRDQNYSYIGGDIVADLIQDNTERYSTSKVKFINIDITNHDFPKSDVWLCRATLYHLSDTDICLALRRFVVSGIKYMLTTNCVTSEDHINADIKTGDWRSLNLHLPPFNFPQESIWEMDDCVPPHPPMKLIMWTREQIESIIPKIELAISAKK